MAETQIDNRIRVVIVEDEGLYRDLLRIALEQHPRLEVVGAFPDGESAIRALPALAPHVAMLDIDLRSSLNGVQVGLLLRRIVPSLGIVLLSNHGDPEFVASLPPEVLSGWSYLLKRSVSDVGVLMRAIEGAASRLVVLDPQLVAGMRPRTGSNLANLTARQREILGLIAEGYTNSAIAQRLVLAEKSVENQINLLYQHLGIDRDRSPLHPRVKAVLLYLQESRPGGARENLGHFTPPASLASSARDRESRDRDQRLSDHRPNDQRPNKDKPKSAASPPSSGRRAEPVGVQSVLLVDDQLAFVELARFELESTGTFRVVRGVTSGEEAISLLPSLRADVAILDVHMPGMNGFELAQRLLKLDPHLQVVMISASDDPQHEGLARAVGARGFLTKKEFSADALRETLGHA